MAPGRSFRSLMGRRRRADEEGEDEEGPDLIGDQSEGSVISAVGYDEVDASSLGAPSASGGGAGPSQQIEGKPDAPGKKLRKGKKPSKKAGKDSVPQESTRPQAAGFRASADTEAMTNGLKVDERTTQEVVDFEDSGNDGYASGPSAPPGATSSLPTSGYGQSPAGRQRRDHEDYKQRRDANPAFIPNRGNFFMHDTRNQSGQSGALIRGGGNSRGRGRGTATVGSQHSPVNHVETEPAAEQPWKHDLHETINEEPAALAKAELPQDRDESARLFVKGSGNQHGHLQSQQRPTPITFSSTTLVGKVQIRISLPGMQEPVCFSDVPWKQYTRLPDHRPPLRRDKPVRISLPGLIQRYIFPSTERSFIFIPRQMRPNQQGFGRFQRNVGGYGYSSRRTSMYGGSMYAASVDASRRSSFGSVAREAAFSPIGSFMGPMPPSRPVVKLPRGPHSQFSTASTPMGPLSGQQTPTGFQVHTFPLPQQPTFQGIPTTTVHQPKPQKAISVNDIESPAVLQQGPATTEAHPFQNQLPAHMHEQPVYGQGPHGYVSPQQQYSYHRQPQNGTPLSGIPEQAAKAASFPMPVLPYGQPYYGYPPQQGYYYPQGPTTYQPLPMYMPQPPGYSMMSPPAPHMSQPQGPPQQPPSQPAEGEQGHRQQTQSQSGMLAHESNGMVYYLPASEAQQQPQGENYQPAESFVPSYAMPGLPPPTPAPESAYYYPQMQMPPYYPSQGEQQ